MQTMQQMKADLIIAAGIRFDDRITGNPDKFCPKAKNITYRH